MIHLANRRIIFLKVGHVCVYDVILAAHTGNLQKGLQIVGKGLAVSEPRSGNRRSRKRLIAAYAQLDTHIPGPVSKIVIQNLDFIISGAASESHFLDLSLILICQVPGIFLEVIQPQPYILPTALLPFHF